jgi:hypothetical protein
VTEVASTPDPPPTGSRPRWLIPVLVGGFLLQFAWRLYLAWPVIRPIAHGDEDGYLLGARVLAGGPDATLPSWSIMRPIGYPLLLTPAYWFAEDPVRVYQIAHVINAVLMAATFPLLYLLARRLFDLARGWAAGITFVLATLPSLVFFSQFALTDALLPALVLMQLLFLYGQFADPSDRAGRWYAIGGGVVAAYAANTHVRGLVMLVVGAAAVALGTWRRWIPRAQTIAYYGSALGVFAMGWLANTWLEDQLFAGQAFSANGRVVQRLTSIKGLGQTICNGAGQVWYLCTSTYGLAAIGLAAAGWAVYRREGSRALRMVYGAALVITVGIAMATAAGTPVEGRVNNQVYGRYLAMLVGFFTLVAVVALIRASRRRAAWLVIGGTAITVLSIAAVLAYAARFMGHETYVSFDAPELSFLSGDWTGLHILRMTLYAIGFMVLFAALLAFVRLRSATLAAVMVLNVVAMVAITDNISLAWARDQYSDAIPQLVHDVGIQPGQSIVEASTIGWWVNLRHQHEVYWQALPRFDPLGPAPTAQYVVASTHSGKPTDWDGTRYGYTLVLTHDEGVNGNWAVWRKSP